MGEALAERVKLLGRKRHFGEDLFDDVGRDFLEVFPPGNDDQARQVNRSGTDEQLGFTLSMKARRTMPRSRKKNHRPLAGSSIANPLVIVGDNKVD